MNIFFIRLKSIVNLSGLFVLMGFFCVWAYLHGIGRVDVFPLILNNVSGALVIVVSSLISFFSVMMILALPSIFGAIFDFDIKNPEQKNKVSDKLQAGFFRNRSYISFTALPIVLIVFAIGIFKGGSMQNLTIITLAIILFVRVFIDIVKVGKGFDWSGKKNKCWLISYLLRKISVLFFKYSWLIKKIIIYFANSTLTLCFCLMSFVPVIFLMNIACISTDSKVLQYVCVACLYALLLLPVIIPSKKNKFHGIKSIVELMTVVFIILCSVFPGVFARVNQQAIEIAGMSSSQETIFSFDSRHFPAYYFPEDAWGKVKVNVKDKRHMVKGIVAFSNVDVQLICPEDVKNLRDELFKNSFFIWQDNKASKEKLYEKTRYCLLINMDEMQSGEVQKFFEPKEAKINES